MTRYVILLTISVFIIQLFSLAFVLTLTMRYKFPVLRHGLICCVANFTGSLAFLIQSVEVSLGAGRIYPNPLIAVIIIHFIGFCLMTYGLPVLVHDFVDLPFPRLLYPFFALQPVLLAAMLLFGKRFLYVRFVHAIAIAALTLLVAIVYSVSLMLWAMFKKSLCNRKYLTILLVLVLLSIPLLIFDSFGPYYYRLRLWFSSKPAGFYLSSFYHLLCGLVIIVMACPYISSLGAPLRKYSISGARKFSFTAREDEVLHLIADGFSTAQMAAHLRISPSTVKKHIYSMFQKTGSENRIDLINSCRERT